MAVGKEQTMNRTTGRPQPFGAAVEQDRINFSVQVPKGKSCALLLYRKGKAQPAARYEMPEEDGVGEVRFLAVQGIDAEKYEYNFEINGKVTIDPYVREITGKKAFGR